MLMSMVLFVQEEPVLNHYAAKVIENVATTSTSHAQVVATHASYMLIYNLPMCGFKLKPWFYHIVEVRDQ